MLMFQPLSSSPSTQRSCEYEGCGPEYDKWSSVRWCNCNKKIAELFWQSKGMCEAGIIPEGPNPHMGKPHGYTHKCIYSNHFFKTNAALKTRHTKKPINGGCKCKPKARGGTLADWAIKWLRRRQAQKGVPTMMMGDMELENVLTATHLGSESEANGNSN